MLNPFEKLKIPPKVNDTVNVMLKRLPKISGSSVKDREIRRLREYYEKVEKYYKFSIDFPRVEELHPFYLESIKIITDINDLKICLSITKKSSMISMRILRKYISEIKKQPENEANRLMREAFGRVTSVLRRSSQCIDKVISIAEELRKLKTVDPELPTIIIAGPPNVGKSTLVSKISTAKPEIANYPFTTKEIHIGHIILNDIYIQVIDTPGILDRPEYKRNKIEKKALNAIRNLSGIIVFMFDSSISSTLSVKEQIDLFEEVLSTNKIIVPVINKIDEKYDECYNKIIEYLASKKVKWYEISAEKEIGLNELKEELFNLIGVNKANEVSRN